MSINVVNMVVIFGWMAGAQKGAPGHEGQFPEAGGFARRLHGEAVWGSTRRPNHGIPRPSGRTTGGGRSKTSISHAW